ncbi:MAG: DUF433 domain-containing protein [Chloroflexi bacterium]|nr:DUF433 domain-containing protein [Chloroflexota bacterium]
MLANITSDPNILGGKPCISGARISIEFILELMASGATRQDILDAYPHLTLCRLDTKPLTPSSKLSFS